MSTVNLFTNSPCSIEKSYMESAEILKAIPLIIYVLAK